MLHAANCSTIIVPTTRPPSLSDAVPLALLCLVLPQLRYRNPAWCLGRCELGNRSTDPRPARTAHCRTMASAYCKFSISLAILVAVGFAYLAHRYCSFLFPSLLHIFFGTVTSMFLRELLFFSGLAYALSPNMLLTPKDSDGLLTRRQSTPSYHTYSIDMPVRYILCSISERSDFIS